MPRATIKYWGTRGSLARPSKNTIHYGGNTPCIEINYKNELIIIDMGTGSYELGKKLASLRLKATVLFTHYHWDHLIGLPFFLPFYNSKNSFTFIGRKGLKKGLNNLLTTPNFPIKLSDFKAKIKLKSIKAGQFKIGPIKILALDVNHSNGAFGYRFTFPGGRSFVHISDNGPSRDDSRLIQKIYGADFLSHDAQYLPEEYLRKKRFGHSPYQYVIDIARRAKTKNIILFHHDPSRSDKDLKKIEDSAKLLVKKIRLKANIKAAREGMTIKL